MHPIRPRFRDQISHTNCGPQVRCAKSTIPHTMSDIRVLVLLLFVCIFQGPRFTPNTGMCVCVCVCVCVYVCVCVCLFVLDAILTLLLLFSSIRNKKAKTFCKKKKKKKKIMVGSHLLKIVSM